MEATPPLDSDEIRKVKESDWLDYSKCAEEGKAIAKERQASLTTYTNIKRVVN